MIKFEITNVKSLPVFMTNMPYFPNFLGDLKSFVAICPFCIELTQICQILFCFSLCNSHMMMKMLLPIWVKIDCKSGSKPSTVK